MFGSPVTVLNDAGGVVSQLKYYAYGRVRSQSAPPGTDKLFTGHQKEGDLYYMKARFYDPLLGRFMAADSGEFSVISFQLSVFSNQR
jgi:RHS repeat-associated protein